MSQLVASLFARLPLVLLLVAQFFKKFPAAGQVTRWQRAVILNEPRHKIVVFNSSFH
jgi:hypothetical protein